MHVFIPVIEIAILAIVINYLLSLFWNAKTIDLLIGLTVLFCLFAVSVFAHMMVLHEVLRFTISILPITLIVLFQNELRLALSKLSLRGTSGKQISEFDHFLDTLAHSIYRMSEKRVGAIIVLENKDTLEEFAHNGVMLKAEFSAELLESIFMNFTPLHDGAVIIRASNILAAACILPLSQDTSQLHRSIGTRHRAGLGLSEITDALVIVVSEETGKVSIAREGVMTRGVKVDRFKGIIRSIFNPPKVAMRPRNIREWLRQ